MCDLGPVTNLGGGERPKKLQVILHNLAASELTKLPESPTDRIALMETVLTKAYAQRKDNSFVIFAAPETYFVKVNFPYRYTKDEFEMVRNRLCEVSKQFPAMLIVPGSVCWSEGAINPPAYPVGRLEKNQKVRVHNTAPVILNGNCFLYHKKHDIDCRDPGAEVFDIPDGMHGIFFASGMTMGIGICGDFDQINKDYEMLSKSGKVEQPNSADVHILIANGQELDAKYCVSKIGGFGIQVDAATVAGFFKLQQDQETPEKRKLDTINPVLQLGNGNDRIIVYGPLDCPPQ
jgi:hypothetical protein